MTIARQRGRCLHCGHDFDEENKMFEAMMKRTAPEARLTEDALLDSLRKHGQHAYVSKSGGEYAIIDGTFDMKAVVKELGASLPQPRVRPTEET